MKINKEYLLSFLSETGLRIDLEIENKSGQVEISLIPLDMEKTNRFVIKTIIGWKTVVSEIELSNYSLPFLKALQNSNETKKSASVGFAKTAIKNGYFVNYQINQIPIDLENIKSWPSKWENFNLKILSKPFDVNEQSLLHQSILLEQECILGVITSLLDLMPISENETQNFEFENLPEGAKLRVEVNKYERNPLNRMACIRFYGCNCQVCGFNFEKTYGNLGRDFIHVHHIIPVSLLGPNYSVNPIHDLIPVCPNCHYMLHKKNPPLTVSELKSLLT